MSSSVSVIIPCHNAASWVHRQIDAVGAQLNDGDELVLVDNRSTDGTRTVLERAAAARPQVRVAEARKRAGANHARNVGMDAAVNDLLLFCDADDRVHPGWVEAFRAALADGGIAGGSAVPVDATGHRVGDELGLHEIYGGPAYPLGATMALHRDVIREVGGFDESFTGGHDETDLAWRAALAGWRCQFVPDARIDYLQRPDPQATARQRRSYARTAVQLWVRHPGIVAPHGVSLKGALRGLLDQLPSGVKVWRRTATLTEAANWGWSLGLVEGHLRYRVLGSPPTRLLPEGDRR